ncbi:MAG TPA: hypothetical protein VIK42_01140 [Bacteroidales bacterium]
MQIKKVCTPEQEKKLQEVFYPLFRNETPESGNGRGKKGNGPGKGKYQMDSVPKKECACII